MIRYIGPFEFNYTLDAEHDQLRIAFQNRSGLTFKTLLADSLDPRFRGEEQLLCMVGGERYMCEQNLTYREFFVVDISFPKLLKTSTAQPLQVVITTERVPPVDGIHYPSRPGLY